MCKVTDFGLSRFFCYQCDWSYGFYTMVSVLFRDIYESNYYRFNINEKKALLPVKWLAIESMEDQIYNHRTDVW